MMVRMRRDDTTSDDYQRAYPGRHAVGHGRYTSAPKASDYLRCDCGWRLVGVRPTERGRDAANRQHFAHALDMRAARV